MVDSLIDKQIDVISESVLRGTSSDVYLVNPFRDAIEEFVSAATSFDKPLPTIHVLAEERTLKAIRDDFIVASTAADLVTEDTLALRSLEDPPQNSLLITENRVITVVHVGDRVGGLVTDDESFVEDIRETYAVHLEDAPVFDLQTPPITNVRETLSEEIGPHAEEDFTAILDSLETLRGDDFDEIALSLLVAAEHETLFYDICKWGENVELASKATFSRKKAVLRDKGLIATEKIPVDVGRPRLRLRIDDKRLNEADGRQFVSVARRLLD